MEVVFEIQLQAITYEEWQDGWINADNILNAVGILVCMFINRNSVWLMEPKGFQSMSESNCICLCFIAYDSEGQEPQAVPIQPPRHRSKGQTRP